MMRIILLIVIIGFPLSVLAQDTVDKPGRYTPTKEQTEANLRMMKLLQNPTFITVRLEIFKPATNEVVDSVPPYKSADTINIRLVLNHSFPGTITITNYNNPHRNLQLELLRDGDVVPYKKEAQQIVERIRTEPISDSSSTKYFVPEKDYVLQWINLSVWYESLLPGHYQLTVKRQFAWEGEWAQSNSITFNIAATDPQTACKGAKASSLPSRLCERRCYYGPQITSDSSPSSTAI